MITGRFFLLIFIWILLTVGTASTAADSSGVRIPPKAVIEEYTNDADYFFDRNNQTQVSVFQKLLSLIIQKLREFFSTETGKDVNTGLKIAAVLLIVFLIIYFAGRKFRAKEGSISSEEKKDTEIRYDINKITDEDLDSLEEYYLANKQYRDAVRTAYIKIIKSLGKRTIIATDIKKTNWDYASEIHDPALKTAFRSATMFFEKIWYGGEDVEQEGYQQWKSQLQRENLRG